MRFIIQRMADPATEAGELPTDELLTAMAEYNRALADAGVFVDGMGLKPSSAGARVHFADGVPVVTDGPFAETRELVAGFTVIETDSREEALAWARRWPALDGDGQVKLELRQVYELEDFQSGPGVDAHAALGERLRRQPTEISPRLAFSGDCREAFECYADALGGHIEAMVTHGETPAADNVPRDWQDRIIYARLRVGRWILQGGDISAECYQRPRGFSVQIDMDDPARAEDAFGRLADGGEITMPIAETFWARRFGMLVDRFGIPWIINCNKPEIVGGDPA